MNHLLNSAVMPHAGCYELISISDETFAAGVLEALANEDLTHYISYKSTLTMVEQLVGVSLGELNLSQLHLRTETYSMLSDSNTAYHPQRKRKIILTLKTLNSSRESIHLYSRFTLKRCITHWI